MEHARAGWRRVLVLTGSGRQQSCTACASSQALVHTSTTSLHRQCPCSSNEAAMQLGGLRADQRAC